MSLTLEQWEEQSDRRQRVRELLARLQAIAFSLKGLQVGEYVCVRWIGEGDAAKALTEAGGEVRFSKYPQYNPPYMIESVSLKVEGVEFYAQADSVPLVEEQGAL